jgi:hypothetical protein
MASSKKQPTAKKKSLEAKSKQKAVKKSKVKKCAKGKHMFSYRGGEAPCIYCGWYLQPDGKVTKRP